MPWRKFTFCSELVKRISNFKGKTSKHRMPLTCCVCIEKWTAGWFINFCEFLIAVNFCLDALISRPDTATRFEHSMAALARFIGFEGQEPESETSRGPDVLWRLGGVNFLVIESKNGATTPTVSKHDANQLTGLMNWFREKYDASCVATPIIIRPSATFKKASTLQCSPF